MGSVDVCLMFLCVCFLVVQGCQRAYGLDVSPPCIDMANQLVQEEGLQEKVRFFQVDATMDTVELWKQGMSALSCCCCCFACNAKSCTHKHTNALKTRVSIVGAPLFFSDPSLSQALSTATVVFLYTYPTLLYKLIPLLDRLTNDFCVRSVITLTYHLPAENGNVVEHNQKHDYCVYRSIRCAAAGAHPAAVDK